MIDPDKGTLTQIGRFPTEKTPRGFAIDPRGKFLLSRAARTIFSGSRCRTARQLHV
jgi:6-phosphogluconolactonase (cycloisomerase 2 family)